MRQDAPHVDKSNCLIVNLTPTTYMHQLFVMRQFECSFRRWPLKVYSWKAPTSPTPTTILTFTSQSLCKNQQLLQVSTNTPGLFDSFKNQFMVRNTLAKSGVSESTTNSSLVASRNKPKINYSTSQKKMIPISSS